jgi:two-component system response regulator
MRNKPFTVLVAEDDLDDQQMIISAFKSTDSAFRVINVSNGIQLMDCLLKRQQFKMNDFEPDLIILDINMPIMDGFDVLTEIRKHENLRKIPVYVVTSSRDIDLLNKALDLGARGFYHKGASVSEINKIINEVCATCTDTYSRKQ